MSLLLSSGQSKSQIKEWGNRLYLSGRPAARPLARYGEGRSWRWFSAVTIHTPCVPADPPKTPTMTVFVEPEGGSQGILDCRVDSEPLASLSLHLGGRLVASSQPHGAPAAPHVRVTATANALRVDIETLRPSDQGEYVCSASNALGSASASTYFGTRGGGGVHLPGPSVERPSSGVQRLPSEVFPASFLL